MKQIEVCAALLINENHQVLSTQRQGGEYHGYWEFPGGKMETGETHQDTLIREIKEELDVDIKVNDYLMTINYQYPNFYLTMHCYFCEITNGAIKLLEHNDAQWLKQSDLDTVDWLEADIEIIEKLKTMTL